VKLSSRQFLDAYKMNELDIAFVGMSNIGKSFTASRMTKAFNFRLIEIDTMIREHMGHESMKEFAKWQGHPFTPDYKEREDLSIQMETFATQQAVDMGKDRGNTILDTTGSVIYIDSAVRRHLRENFYVVHIKAEPSDLDRLTGEYFDNPKPLVWRHHYRPVPGLSGRENIRLCYPELLMSRARDYIAMADQTVTSGFVLNPDTTDRDLFNAIKPAR